MATGFLWDDLVFGGNTKFEKTQNRHIQVPQNHGKTELEMGNFAGCLDVCHPIAPVLQDQGQKEIAAYAESRFFP